MQANGILRPGPDFVELPDQSDRQIMFLFSQAHSSRRSSPARARHYHVLQTLRHTRMDVGSSRLKAKFEDDMSIAGNERQMWYHSASRQADWRHAHDTPDQNRCRSLENAPVIVGLTSAQGHHSVIATNVIAAANGLNRSRIIKTQVAPTPS